ncbi:BTAD domain-containing putative transcriptional regulator [Amycolatopsis magusensis]|uniref:BTAD domain-containing putative transcriptional regulator n=1 Tax=Amycolatopsis magusensis TaxID=882444 RepID=UPI003C2EA05A
MRFNLLGPLEVFSGDNPIGISGHNRRATLGFLLLHANNVVATSRLLQAVWSGDAPQTARKILHNAIADLRGVLAGAGPGAPELLTTAPGYLLRIDPRQVDLFRFHELVEHGRAELTARSFDTAAATLREALALWRGPALADLIESGIRWPELLTVQNAKLAAIEDCMEAELAGGRHHEVIGELEAVAEAEPLRERLAGQLMLALYRCGRQADALTAYRRTRTALVDSLGLDPSRDLQALERAILNHDPSLSLPAELMETPPALASIARLEFGEPPPRPAAGVTLERKRVSAVLVRSEPDPATEDPEDLGELHDEQTELVHAEARRHGGSVRGSIGSTWLVLFGVPRTGEHDAVNAVRTALALRDRLCRAHATVTTGDALVSLSGRRAPEVAGGLLATGLRMLAEVPLGEVRACAVTQAATSHAFDFTGQGDTARVDGPVTTTVRPSTGPMIGRDRELGRLHGLLDEVRRWQRSHLVAVLGEPGIGKSRLLAEFGRSARELREPVRVVRALGGEPLEVFAELVRSCAGIDAGDPFATAAARLAETVHLLLGTGHAAAWAAAHLRTLLWEPNNATLADSVPACRALLEGAASTAPLVVLLDDLHLAGEPVHRFVEDLAQPVPLLVVTTGQPEPARRDTTTMTLEPLSDAATARLLGTLTGRPGRQYEHLVRRIGGNPRFAAEYARVLPEATPSPAWRWAVCPAPAVPPTVHAMLAAQLDALPPGEKAVLRDAAVLDDPFTPEAVAALGEYDLGEVVKLLETLGRQDLLRAQRRLADGIRVEFSFRSPLLREVARSQLPRRVLAEKQARAGEWAAPPTEEASSCS